MGDTFSRGNVVSSHKSLKSVTHTITYTLIQMTVLETVTLHLKVFFGGNKVLFYGFR